MRARIAEAVLAVGLVAMGALHAGCSGCAPLSAAEARDAELVLDGASGPASLALVVTAPEQSCPPLCNFCPAPTLTVRLVAEIARSDGAVAGALPVVRVSITPRDVAAGGMIDPEPPVDVVLRDGESLASEVIELTRGCPLERRCDTAYDLRVERVDAGLDGALSVRMSASVAHVSTEDESLAVEFVSDAS